MLEKLKGIEARYEDIEAQLSDSAVYADSELLRRLTREQKELEPIVAAYRACRKWEAEEAAARCRALGGIPVPAHIDRESYSVLSVLGIMPEQPVFEAVELRDPQKMEGLLAAGRIAPGYELLTGSDAHCLEEIAARPHLLGENSVLWPLVRGR